MVLPSWALIHQTRQMSHQSCQAGSSCEWHSSFECCSRDSLIKLLFGLIIAIRVSFIVVVLPGTVVLVLIKGPTFVIWSRMHLITMLAWFLASVIATVVASLLALVMVASLVT